MKITLSKTCLKWARERAGLSEADLAAKMHVREELVPLSELRAQWNAVKTSNDAVQRLVKHFKVSSLVVLRRLRDAEILKENEFRMRYTDALTGFNTPRAEGGGGNFYRTLRTRLGRRFASAVVESALEGRTIYRDAYRLLGVSSADHVRKLAQEVEVAA